MSYLDVTGAAARLRLSYNQVLRLILKGELQAVRIAGRWRVDRESVEAFAAARAAERQVPA